MVLQRPEDGFVRMSDYELETVSAHVAEEHTKCCRMVGICQRSTPTQPELRL